jgi:hypothetical protein
MNKDCARVNCRIHFSRITYSYICTNTHIHTLSQLHRKSENLEPNSSSKSSSLLSAVLGKEEERIMFQQMQSMAQKQVLKLFLSVAIHIHNYKYIYIYICIYMCTYIICPAYIYVYTYIFVCITLIFDRRSLRIFNTHTRMYVYTLTLTIC